ncbi:unnamed protein product [Staurois parvus]|uniref:Uncharacterized protein n=1 Tax=Staurois parvus TaxID=386267 RepID=A0ABN9BDN8_9NEOB|nr:unnamed protein product [Staurois parvus]
MEIPIPMSACCVPQIGKSFLFVQTAVSYPFVLLQTKPVSLS